MARVNLTVKMEDELLDRLRDAVVAVGPPVTIATIVGDGVERELRRLERQRGAKFPRRGRPVRMGRPRKVR